METGEWVETGGSWENRGSGERGLSGKTGESLENGEIGGGGVQVRQRVGETGGQGIHGVREYRGSGGSVWSGC